MTITATQNMTIHERLDHYTYTEPNTGCWLWGGVTNGVGYGRLKVGRKMLYAHRLQWERHNGAIPKAMLVCPKCDVPTCINPEHLFLGTFSDNIKDAVQKGRTQKGGDTYNARLSEPQVIEIFHDKRAVEVISEEYKISITHVYQIKRGDRWKHLKLKETK